MKNLINILFTRNEHIFRLRSFALSYKNIPLFQSQITTPKYSIHCFHLLVVLWATIADRLYFLWKLFIERWFKASDSIFLKRQNFANLPSHLILVLDVYLWNLMPNLPWIYLRQHYSACRLRFRGHTILMTLRTAKNLIYLFLSSLLPHVILIRFIIKGTHILLWPVKLKN